MGGTSAKLSTTKINFLKSCHCIGKKEQCWLQSIYSSTQFLLSTYHCAVCSEYDHKKTQKREKKGKRKKFDSISLKCLKLDPGKFRCSDSKHYKSSPVWTFPAL